MSGLSDYMSDKILNFVKGTSAGSAPTSLYVALFTTQPADDGTGGVEVSGNAYARTSVTFGSISAASPGRQMSNTATITFPTATPSGWGTIVGFGIYDASSAGNLLGLNTFSSSISSTASSAVTFAAGQLVFKVD